MWVCDDFSDYEIIDATSGEKLERFGKYIFVRPDPQVIWKTKKLSPLWEKAHAVYKRSVSGGGAWDFRTEIKPWTIEYKDLKFLLSPFSFKHTGIFPEQAVNWNWMRELIDRSGREINVLNLFAYTGGATVACAKSGASVCHVDAAKGMVERAKENARLCGLSDAKIRYIVDDCMKFVEREIKRGNKYDAIIMDPPSYGRGPGGEMWKLEDKVFDLVSSCVELLSSKPLFFLINAYTTGLAPSVLSYILGETVNKSFLGKVESSEIGIIVKSSGLALPAGASGRWTAR